MFITNSGSVCPCAAAFHIVTVVSLSVREGSGGPRELLPLLRQVWKGGEDLCMLASAAKARRLLRQVHEGGLDPW